MLHLFAVNNKVRILCIGSANRMEEMKPKLISHDVVYAEGNKTPASISEAELIIALNLDEESTLFKQLAPLSNKWVMGCAVKKSLQQMIKEYNGEISCRLIGFNALPTFIGRNKAEVSFLTTDDRDASKELFKQLKWETLEVADRVGMVTPRTLFMIINETCCTLHEGTASLTDIDKAMKLGTNYPYGPFEWCDRIGVKDVYETLLAIGNDTKDERYVICELLKEKYLKREKFYS